MLILTCMNMQHAFLEFSAATNFYHESTLWFNNEHNTDFNLSSQQLLFRNYNLPQDTNPTLSRKFGIFAVLPSKYFY